MQTRKVAILGAGNGAHAMAGHLSMQGAPVRLYNRFEEEIVAMREQGGVTVEGAVEGFGPLELVTTDPAPVVGWADVLMVVVPAFAHRLIAETCALHLRDGQILILNPGRSRVSIVSNPMMPMSGSYFASGTSMYSFIPKEKPFSLKLFPLISLPTALSMFFKELPGIVEHSLFYDRLNRSDLQTHIEVCEDVDALRNKLDGLNLIGFVSNGSLLPRASGIDPAPLADNQVVRFKSPAAFQTDITLPNSGNTTGMGIPKNQPVPR